MKVGDYVRTKYGISKIENISPNEYDEEHNFVELDKSVFDGLDTQSFFTTDEIIKSSPNIIDLIEVGDYVNGHRIEEVSINKYDVKVLYYEIPSDYGYEEMLAKQIKSIVTKEQFSQMEYKVGD